MGERHNEREEILFIAPENFSMVEDGVYRSAFPRSKNMAFLDKLGLRSALSLVPEDYPEGLKQQYENSGIKLLAMGIDGNKWPFKEIKTDLHGANFSNVNLNNAKLYGAIVEKLINLSTAHSALVRWSGE